MRTATGTLTTAITSKERRPVHVALADWLGDGSFTLDPGIARDVAADVLEGLGDMGDLTPWVESFTLDEALATDRPAGARSFPGGYASAEATIVLSGSLGGMRLAELFSGFDNPLSTLAPRIGAPVTVDLGMIGSVGPETVGVFTGKVRSCSVDPDAGTVTLVALDNRERFRTPVVLPVVFADDHALIRPGGNAQWLMDAIAAVQGYRTWPSLRSSVIVAASLRGSATPSVGTLIAAGQATGAGLYQVPPTFGQGRDGLAFQSTLTSPLVSGKVQYAPTVAPNLNNGSNIFVEFWGLSRPRGGLGLDNLLIMNNSGGSALWQLVIAITNGGDIQVLLTRNGSLASTTVLAGTPVATYVGVHVALTAAGATVNVKIGSSTASGTIVVGNSTGSLDMDRMAFDMNEVTASNGYVAEGMQITTEAYSAGMFNDAFVPTATLDPSLNELTSTPTVDTSDPWLLVQQIADAEQGFANFDGDTFIFRNRDHLSGGAAVATITTRSEIAFANLKQSPESSEAIDTVLNRVSGSGTPYVLDPPSTVVWSLSEVMSVPAGASITIPVEFPGPLHTLTSRTYRASQTADGTGGDITNLTLSSVAVTASSYLTTVYNPNAFAAYLVGNLSGGTPGEPNLTVVGRCVRPAENGYTSVATDAASVALYGTQPLDLPESVWRQAAAPLAALVAGLLANLKDPHPELADLEIVGDPRLQLGDRVRVADPDGLVLDDDFWVVGVKTRYSASDGLAQTVTLRLA